MLVNAWLCILVPLSVLARPSELGERASSKPCQPDPLLPRYGLFGGITDKVVRFGLDAHYQLVEQSKAKVKSFNATFEVCSALGKAVTTYKALDSPVLGRIVLTPSIGGKHTCMTIVNPHDAGTGKPLFAKAEECVDNVKPPLNQAWIYGYIDDYGGMFWVGDSKTPGHKDGYGILEKGTTAGSLITDKSGRIELARRVKPARGTQVLDFEFL